MVVRRGRVLSGLGVQTIVDLAGPPPNFPAATLPTADPSSLLSVWGAQNQQLKTLEQRAALSQGFLTAGSITAWLQSHSTAVYLAAGGLALLAIFKGMRR